MNVKLVKRFPSFSLKLKHTENFVVVDATALTLSLKRVSIDNVDGSIDISLENTLLDLNEGNLTITSDYLDSFIIKLTPYEVDQINVLMLNYLNLIEEKTTVSDLH